jgi:Flp pilus assembly protein TadG
MRTILYRKHQRGSVMIFLLLLLPVFLIPLVGLAIDGTMLYIVQAKLSAAVDGAALGAGRLLGTSANSQEIAHEFVTVNFPTGYWGTKNLRPYGTNTDYAVVTNTIGQTSIAVSASVDVPLLFMRVLGFTQSTVSATGTATRGGTRVVLVLDRSDSMNNPPGQPGNAFDTMIQSADNFVGMFTPGSSPVNDEVGVVTFSDGGVVAYPTYTAPWINSVTGTGGPNGTFYTSNNPPTGTVYNQINSITYGGFTNTAEALSMAFVELQKSYNHDIAANGTDNRLNAIVMFTDGEPTAVTMQPNLVNGNVSTSSACTHKWAGSPAVAANTMLGWAGTVPPSYNGGGSYTAPNGILLMEALDPTHSQSYWLTWNNGSDYNGGAGDLSASTPSTAIAGCATLANGSGLGDLAKLPVNDFWGNNMQTGHNSYQSVSLTIPTDGNNFAKATLNAADYAGYAIRSSNVIPGGVVIYTIGYTGNGGLNADLLNRIANSKSSSSYDNTEQVGMYVEVNNLSDLNAAFSAVASDLLRLAK